MKSIAVVLNVVSFLMLGQILALAGTTSLTTYYPAPNGNYDLVNALKAGVGVTVSAATTDTLEVAGYGTGYGAIYGACGGNYTGIRLTGAVGNGGGCGNYNILSSPSDETLYLNRPSGNSMHFRENNADQMVIEDGGFVDIGPVATFGVSWPLTTYGTGAGQYGATPEIFVNGDNHTGGGISISDDGGFYDYNDAWVTFNGSTGLKIAGNSGKASYAASGVTNLLVQGTAEAKDVNGIDTKISFDGDCNGNTTAFGFCSNESIQTNNSNGWWGEVVYSNGAGIYTSDNSGYYAELAPNNGWTLVGNGTIGTNTNVNGWWAGYFYSSNGLGVYSRDSDGYWTELDPNNAWSVQGNGTIGTTNVNGWYAGYFVSSSGVGVYSKDSDGYITELDTNDGYGVNTNGYVYSSNGGYSSYLGNGGWGLLTNAQALIGWGTGNQVALGGWGGYGVYSWGTIATSGGTITASDERLKKDIKPITDALDKVERLNGVSFKWKKDGRKDIGVIAQNVEKVFPEIVKTLPTGMKSVEYSNLVAVLIQAIKEQQQEIKDQQKEIDALEQKLGGTK